MIESFISNLNTSFRKINSGRINDVLKYFRDVHSVPMGNAEECVKSQQYCCFFMQQLLFFNELNKLKVIVILPWTISY